MYIHICIHTHIYTPLYYHTAWHKVGPESKATDILIIVATLLQVLLRKRSYIRTLWSKFPGHPVVRILSFTALSPDSTPGQGTKTPQDPRCSKKKRKKRKRKVGSRTMLSSRTFCNDKKCTS